MVNRRLGKGLEFFLGDGGSDPEDAAESPDRPVGEEVLQVDLGMLSANPFQPRKEFGKAELEELASSLRTSGVLQPILVRKVPGGDAGRYEIIAGERRWRAAKLAGLERIPALVKEVTDDAAAIVALVENVQRTDLNAIEKAKAFRQIQNLSKLSQAELAKQVGLERSTVANMLRLLELPEEVQRHVSRGTLSMGHARALLGLAGSEEQKKVAEEVIKKRLSVREVEQLIQELNLSTEPPSSVEAGRDRTPRSEKGRPLWLNEIEETLVEALGTPVTVKYGKKRSKITIECVGREEFERVYEALKGIG